MSDTSHPSDELFTLQRQARLNQLRLKIARQNEALSTLRQAGHRDTLEGYYDPANYFDPRDYLFETPRFVGAVPTTLNDRDEGRNYPIFRTEQDLALIRGAARWLTASNPIALGVLTSLTNYVIGNGFQYAAAAAARSAAGKQLAATANDVIDEFLDENDWSGDLDRELFQRSRIDGEYFLGLWHIGGGHVQARTIEPDQVTEPTNKSGLEAWLGCNCESRAGGFASNWGFGVHTHEVDAQAVHGFYVQWSNRDTDWDYFPGGNEPIVSPDGPGMWLEHAKLNVVRSVKRGLSDFYPIDGNLELARRVLRNMGEGSAVQAAIAWIQEVAPGTTQAQAHSGTLSRADGSYTKLTQQGTRAQATQHYDPATILKVPSGQKYLPGPLGTQHAPNFITAAEALLRTVALRWNLPENLITGSAANNNFASALVAETPFVKYAESQQQFYAQRDRKTLWRVLRFAWQAGRFGDVPWNAVKRSLDITVTPPQVEVRDPEKETKVRQMLNAAGVLSKKTWSAQESLDFDQEQKNLGQEGESQGGAGRQPQQQFNTTAGELAEALEWWDPAKHPRNEKGQFTETAGGDSGIDHPAINSAATTGNAQSRQTDDKPSQAKLPPPAVAADSVPKAAAKSTAPTSSASSGKPQQSSSGSTLARGTITYLQILATAAYIDGRYRQLQEGTAKRLADAVNGGLITQAQAKIILDSGVWKTPGFHNNPNEQLKYARSHVDNEVLKLLVANATTWGLPQQTIDAFVKANDLQGLAKATKALAAAPPQSVHRPSQSKGDAQPTAAAGSGGSKVPGGKPPTTGEEDDPKPKRYRGGRHRFTKKPMGDGLYSHHTPAAAINGLDRDDGPAIQMDLADHQRTASNGSGEDAARYRKKQEQLIRRGEFGAAIQMDIDDIRSKFGTKYDQAIREMLQSLDPRMKNGLRKDPLNFIPPAQPNLESQANAYVYI